MISIKRNLDIAAEGIRAATDPIEVRTKAAYTVGYIDALADTGFMSQEVAQAQRNEFKVMRNRRLIQLGTPLESTDL